MMEKDTRVLVFPCGSEIALEIHQALKWSKHIRLYGASSIQDHGKCMYKNYIGGLPRVEEKTFIQCIRNIIKKYDIDYLFPAHDSAVVKLAQEQKRLGCEVIGSSAETCCLCRSKGKTYERFRSMVLTPRIYQKGSSDIPFPVFLKPDVGQGSKGVFKAYSDEDIEFYLKKDPTLLVLEYLPGREYTVDCFTDRLGRLRFVGARERLRIMNGISVRTRSGKENRFGLFAEKINEALVPRGTWFFQVKENQERELVLQEIAPRIAGGMALYRNVGVNFPLLSIYDAMGLDLSIVLNSYSIEMDRALKNVFLIRLKYKHVFIDLDDTILLRNRVNPWVMAFLYQCINEGVKLHLLTKHEDVYGERVKKVLKRYRLETIFDSVIRVGEKEEKADYIDRKSAIFIDDSFGERERVKKSLGIPTFDTSGLESLLNWKY